MRVFKFGGASVKDAEAIKNVSNILQNYKGQALAVVISAMGKTTNALEKVVHAYFNKTGEAQANLELVKKAHYTVMKELFSENEEVFAAVNDTFVEIEWILEDEPEESFDYIYDQIVSIGEFLSTKIVSAYLNKVGLPCTWLDCRDVIRTDNTYREAKIDWSFTERRMQEVMPSLLEKGFVLTQGFIGGTSENFTTTLGREGSDYTAAIVSYCMNAEGMSVWKNVPGILTADPRLFKNWVKIDRLTYLEAIEMTYYGAKVIHPKTIKPLQNKSIPMNVKSFLEPDSAGTIISSQVVNYYPPVIVVAKDQLLLQISTRDFSFVAEENLSHFFSLFAKYRNKVNMMQNTAISFSVCLDNIPERIAPLLKELEDEFNVVIDKDLELITVRHYQKEILNTLRKGKMVLLEEKIRNTAQLVVKDLPKMQRLD